MDPRTLQHTAFAPFKFPDFTAMMPQAAAPSQAFALYKSGFDTWLALVNAALAGAERIRMTQLATDVETLGENHRAAVDGAAARDVPALLAVQAGLAHAYMEGWMRYWAAVAEAMQSTQAEVGRILSAGAAGAPVAASGADAPTPAIQRKAA
jgi:hypothetical protein